MAVGWGDTGLILVVLVIRSAGGGIQTPAVQSFIPQIAPEAWLLRVNAINGTLQTAISIASRSPRQPDAIVDDHARRRVHGDCRHRLRRADSFG